MSLKIKDTVVTTLTVFLTFTVALALVAALTIGVLVLTRDRYPGPFRVCSTSHFSGLHLTGGVFAHGGGDSRHPCFHTRAGADSKARANRLWQWPWN